MQNASCALLVPIASRRIYLAGFAQGRPIGGRLLRRHLAALRQAVDLPERLKVKGRDAKRRDATLWPSHALVSVGAHLI